MGIEGIAFAFALVLSGYRQGHRLSVERAFTGLVDAFLTDMDRGGLPILGTFRRGKELAPKGLEGIAFALALVLFGLKPGDDRLSGEQQFARLSSEFLTDIETDYDGYLCGWKPAA